MQHGERNGSTMEPRWKAIGENAAVNTDGVRVEWVDTVRYTAFSKDLIDAVKYLSGFGNEFLISQLCTLLFGDEDFYPEAVITKELKALNRQLYDKDGKEIDRILANSIDVAEGAHDFYDIVHVYDAQTSDDVEAWLDSIKDRAVNLKVVC